MAAVGDPGLFFADEAAHIAGQGTPCTVIAVSGSTVSIATHADPSLPYGPIASPFVWTVDATPVPTTPQALGYYFQPAPAIAANAASAAQGIASAASASDRAALDLTPHPLIDVIPGSWNYDRGLDAWVERFPNEPIVVYVSANVQIANYKLFVQDRSASPMLITVSESVRVSPPTLPSFVQIGSEFSDGTGSPHEVTVSLTSSGSPCRHRIVVTAGTALGGATPADQYQIRQIYNNVV